MTIPEVTKVGFLGPLMRALKRRLFGDTRRQTREREHEAAAGDKEDHDGRQARGLGLPREILDRNLSQKVLHGWLQNRHQVLVPLTFRLGRLEQGDIDLLMRFTAVALLNGSTADEASRHAVDRWLRGIGADESAVAAFQAALSAPTPLSSLLEAVRERELAVYAYAAAVTAVDNQEASGRLFANYIAARLSLPADAVRSIDRRYRR